MVAEITKRIVLIACATAPLTWAQSPRDTSRDRAGDHAIEAWAGYSARSPKWGYLGNRPGLSFGLAAARWSRRVKTRPGYALEYTMDFIPVAFSSPPLGFIYGDTAIKRPPRQSATVNCMVSVFKCLFPSGSAYAFGVSPLGITAVYRRDKLFQPRIGATGGILFFDRAVPTVISTRINLTATIEAGAQMLSRNGHGVLVAYRFHHFSNAGAGEDNSALASHVISFGVRWGRTRRAPVN